MKIKYLINAYLERYDRDKYVKPYFINLPHSKGIEKCYFEEHWLPGAKLVDSKAFGIMLHFFYALSEPNEKLIKLEVVFSNEIVKDHKGWIELERKHERGAYEVHDLNNYDGEPSFLDKKYMMTIDISKYYYIPNPEYIYIKKV